MSERQDAARAKVEAERRKRAGLFHTIRWEFWFSEAGRAIASHPSAPAVYLHVLARQPLPPKARERKRLEKLGLWPPKEHTPFSFPIEEGPEHGIGRKALYSGLRILHDVGRIDRIHPGSAKRGDYALYVLSERWRLWGQPGFDEKEWEKAPVIGTRDTTIIDGDGNVVHKGTGKFLKRRTPKTSRKVRVVASKATSKPSLVASKDTREKPLVAPKAMNQAPEAELLVAPKAILLSSPYLSLNSGNKKKVRGMEVSNSGQSRRRDLLPSKGNGKFWRPPKAEVQENVVEILRQRPDPRADDRRFVSSLVDQLHGGQRGRLDAGRVHADLQHRHGLDGWTSDLLYAIAMIDRPHYGEATQ